MKTKLFKLLQSDLGSPLSNYIIFLYRVAISFELIIVHGLKKIGIGVASAEIVPNPFGFPHALNEILAISANLICPVFIIIGLGTRMVCIPIIIVTLTGYFIVHSGDTLIERDIPFMYSISFLLIAFTGGGHCSWDNIIYEKYQNKF